MSEREIDTLIAQLIKLGEDPEELEFWTLIFDDLEAPEQQEILTNLKEEIKDLLAAS